MIKMKTLISPASSRHHPQTSSGEGTCSFLYLHNSLTWLLYSSSPAHYAPLVLLGFEKMEGRGQVRGKQVWPDVCFGNLVLVTSAWKIHQSWLFLWGGPLGLYPQIHPSLSVFGHGQFIHPDSYLLPAPQILFLS